MYNVFCLVGKVAYLSVKVGTKNETKKSERFFQTVTIILYHKWNNKMSQTFGKKFKKYIYLATLCFWLASLHLWGNARNCGRQLSAQDLLLWVSRTLQFRTNKTKSNLIENIMGAWFLSTIHTYIPSNYVCTYFEITEVKVHNLPFWPISNWKIFGMRWIQYTNGPIWYNVFSGLFEFKYF